MSFFDSNNITSPSLDINQQDPLVDIQLDDFIDDDEQYIVNNSKKKRRFSESTIFSIENYEFLHRKRANSISCINLERVTYTDNISKIFNMTSELELNNQNNSLPHISEFESIFSQYLSDINESRVITKTTFTNNSEVFDIITDQNILSSNSNIHRLSTSNCNESVHFINDCESELSTNEVFTSTDINLNDMDNDDVCFSPTTEPDLNIEQNILLNNSNIQQSPSSNCLHDDNYNLQQKASKIKCSGFCIIDDELASELLRSLNRIDSNIKNILSMTIDNEREYLVHILTEGLQSWCSNLILNMDTLVVSCGGVFRGFLVTSVNIDYELSNFHQDFGSTCICMLEHDTLIFKSNSGCTIEIKFPWQKEYTYVVKKKADGSNYTGGHNKLLLVSLFHYLKLSSRKILTERFGMNFVVLSRGSYNECHLNKKPKSEKRAEGLLIKILLEKNPNLLNIMKHRTDIKSDNYNYLYLWDEDTGLWSLQHNSTICLFLKDQIFKYISDLSDDEIYLLNTVSFQEKLRKAIIGYILSNEFTEKLDNNRNVFVCNNGVFDCVEKIFRKTRPEDYVSISTGWNYDSFEAEDYLEELNEFFQKLYPIEEDRNIAIRFFSQLLTGKHPDKTILMVTDESGGNNGKTAMRNLLHSFLGNLMMNSRSFLLQSTIQPDRNSHSAHLQVIKSVRLICSEELKASMKIDESLLKDLSGGTECTEDGRKMYSDKKTTGVLQALIMMIFNDDNCPQFDSADSALHNRFRFLVMKSTFSEKFENDDWTKFQFKLDPFISEKMQKWNSALLYVLMAEYINYPNGMIGMSESKSSKSIKNDILINRNEFREWYDKNPLIKATEDHYVTIKDMKSMYFAQCNLWNRDKVLNRNFTSIAIKLLSLQGIYVKRRHKFYDEDSGTTTDLRNVIFGYTFEDKKNTIS